MNAECASIVRRPAVFRYEAPGALSAKLAAEEPATPIGAALARTRRALFGNPLRSEADITERLPKWKALPVFSSHAMSSVAYGPEAAMYTLLAAGTLASAWLMPITDVILVVLLLITLSYRQMIQAYPNGGGSYIVAHANLGGLLGLVAAALRTDYALTVAISVSSGVFNLASAFPVLGPVYVPLARLRAAYRHIDPCRHAGQPAVDSRERLDPRLGEARAMSP